MIDIQDLHWRQIITAPNWLRHLVALSISMLIAAAGWYGVMSPELETAEHQQQQWITAQQTTQTYQRQLLKQPAADFLNEQLHQLDTQLQPYYYSAAQPADFIRYFTDFIALSGCQLIDIKRVSDTTAERFRVLRWQVKIQSSYFQFIEFVRLINSGSQLVTFNELAITGDSLLTLNMTISVYRLERSTS
ncbi:MAG: hypothetical protein LBN41_01620 [Enterobacteriaceae bacterium]|jgi:Tfp pilus assembly protein PilO|nr:hypothetical protein [Enterobacteriaceae bacterium]